MLGRIKKYIAFEEDDDDTSSINSKEKGYVSDDEKEINKNTSLEPLNNLATKKEEFKKFEFIKEKKEKKKEEK